MGLHAPSEKSIGLYENSSCVLRKRLYTKPMENEKTLTEVTEAFLAMRAGYQAALRTVDWTLPNRQATKANTAIVNVWERFYKVTCKGLKVSRNGGPLLKVRRDDLFKAGSRFYL